MKISIVIASRNEGDELAATCANLADGAPGAEIIVVDDASDKPERGYTIRNERRLGVAKSRAIGFARSSGDVCGFVDAHMHFKRGAIESVAEAALDAGGFAYAGCNGHAAATLRRTADGLFACHWTAAPKVVSQTTGMMGACYFAPRDVLLRMGGWIQLPGHYGMDEEAMSILAARCGVPIVNVPQVDNWHLFRGQRGSASAPVPYTLTPDMVAVNVAATHRFLFGDDVWPALRAGLLNMTALHGQPMQCPERVIRMVETPAFDAYRAALQSRMTVSGTDFIRQIEGAAR
ncbi:MAG: Glycosyl transferase family 2 [Verrucomicrobia bacterium ADurb.Bin070]|nr:MAG: Glycosyl transferase family 2 [Verrucomicrobia bacterium ADurb.Bin070]